MRTKKLSTRSLLLLAVVLIAVQPLLVSKAAANGGGRPWLNNVPAGPYEVSLFTLPSQPDLATTHFSVLVTQPGQAKALDDVTVLLNFSPPDGGDPQGPYLASRSNDSAPYHDASVVLAQLGDWVAEITVRGVVYGEGMTRFVLPVRERAFPWRTLLIGFGPMLALGALLVLRRSPRASRHYPQ